MIISKTPYRISLFGGGSDYPAWFRENGGKVVSLAINKYCYLTTRILPPFFDHNYRIAYSQVETVKSFSEIMHPVVRESIRRYSPNSRLEVHHDGDLPARSGIGSSSAFAVGMINSLLTLQNASVSQLELANLAIQMECGILQENVGWQDQIACAIGGINEIKFGPGDTWATKQIALSEAKEEEMCSRIVLVFTGVNRNSTDISAGLVDSIKSKSQQLFRVMKLASLCKEILVSSGDLDQVGEMLDESWHLKKLTNGMATSSSLDSWYDRGMRAGALGGKVLGAGGGGFFMFWVKKDGRDKFIRNLGEATIVPIGICHNGSSIIYKGEVEDKNANE